MFLSELDHLTTLTLQKFGSPFSKKASKHSDWSPKTPSLPQNLALQRIPSQIVPLRICPLSWWALVKLLRFGCTYLQKWTGRSTWEFKIVLILTTTDPRLGGGSPLSPSIKILWINWLGNAVLINYYPSGGAWVMAKVGWMQNHENFDFDQKTELPMYKIISSAMNTKSPLFDRGSSGYIRTMQVYACV